MFRRKLHRAREALYLVTRSAADMASRRALIGIYRALSQPERRDDRVALRLDFGGRVFPVTLRVQDIFVLGEMLFEQQYRLRSRLPAQPVVFDAGANVGLASLWFAAHHPGLRLHAFEPEAENFALTSGNLAAVPGARVLRAAIGREKGSCTLHLAAFGAVHSVRRGFAPEVSSQTVPQITLAGHMADEGVARVDLLKLDVEGAELDALIGLGDRIRDIAVITGEMHETVVDPGAFYRFLNEAGFELIWKGDFNESETERVHGFEVARREERKVSRARGGRPVRRVAA